MKSVYLTATEPRSGKSVVAVGLMNLFRERVDRVGYIKPIGYGTKERLDEDVDLLRHIYEFDVPSEVMNPLTINRAGQMLADGNTDELLTKVLRAHRQLTERNDLIIVEGTDYKGMISALEFDINADISKNLDAPVVMVASGLERSAEEIVEQVTAAKESFDEKGCDFIGVIVTQVEMAVHDQVQRTVESKLERHNIDLLGVMPYNEILARPRMGEIARKINARVMFGHEYLRNLTKEPRVAAMSIGNALERFFDGMLLITSGDREDMIVAAMTSRVATTYPNISGIILTGGLEPADSVKRLIGGLGKFNIPILQVPYDTFEITKRISRMPVSLYAGDTEKLNHVYQDMKRYINQRKINRFLEIPRTPKTTPLVFLNGILEKARANRKRIVLPEGEEERTLKAVSRVLDDSIADIVLLGDPDTIRENAIRVDAKIETATIIDPAQSELLKQYSAAYYKMREHKGISKDHAHDVIIDPIYFGTMMVHLGDADGLVSGAVHTTRHTITPAFQIIKTKPDVKQVSSIFFMCLEDRVLIYGDCAVIPNPSEEDLADIGMLSAKNAEAFGFEPLVAMLSYSTGASGVGPEVERVKNATDMIKKRMPDLKVEGPIQYDAAISPETAKTKLPGSDVAGKANVFIFPDLNAGNTAYKAVQRSAKAIAVGPVLQGLAKPVNDLSRGALVEDIVYTIAITSIQAQIS